MLQLLLMSSKKIFSLQNHYLKSMLDNYVIGISQGLKALQNSLLNLKIICKSLIQIHGVKNF